MFQAVSRPGTATSVRVSSADAAGPVLSARAASPTALRYWATPNFAGSPSPTTSTRGAATPSRSCNSMVLPGLPERSPRSASARRRPPQAASMACAAGVKVASANAPTTTQSTLAVMGASRLRRVSRLIRGSDGETMGVSVQCRGCAWTEAVDSKASPWIPPAKDPDAAARPLPSARIRPGHLRRAGRAADGQPRRPVRQRARADRGRAGARGDDALAARPADPALPAADPAAGADARAAAGGGPAVPRRRDAGARLGRGRPAADAAAADAAGAAGGGGDRGAVAVAGPVGQGDLGRADRREQPQRAGGRAR